MTHDFQPWTPPPCAVVAPPVHPETRVQVIYSDGEISDAGWRASSINWSGYGDGPRVVAYAVVEEYKELPKVAREWWLTSDFAVYSDPDAAARNNMGLGRIIHVREVPDPSREVVAPRAMKAVWNDCRNCFEIYVTNVDYRDGTTMTVFGDLP